MHIFVGLGNPGQRYVGTRHNLGFMAIDKLSSGAAWKSECKALVQKTRIANFEVLLAKPQTFMNLSGESVQALLAFYKVKPENLLVFSDDVNLACGKMRIRPNGSAGGQNGLKSIIAHIGQDFARVRIGAGLVPEHWDLVNWVLSAISKEDLPLCEQVLGKIPNICEAFLAKGVAAAQNEFNG
ncbi:MAG: aminoacyl-tRNA hydrolase [Fibromonadaceae bacterium]|jgi:PTH1 family peptidyl-tRNA hydrolase|nr:aminoacyl-tRNA hydrolase [Fibromonadaceae bacterium]